MKTIKLCLAIAGALVMTSCSFQVYSTKGMAENYALRMDTKEELEVKSKVKIFLNESDVKGEYEVLSFVTYSPFTIPVVMSHQKQITKKFYEKAAMKAHQLGGNGLIVIAGGYFKVINLKNWVADDVTPATFVNVIFDRTLMDKFANGSVAKLAKNSEKRREESAFKAEIESNISAAKELKEVEFVDEYRGKQVPDGKKSVTIRLIIASSEKTLTSAEIETVANSAIKKLSKTLGADVRGK